MEILSWKLLVQILSHLITSSIRFHKLFQILQDDSCCIKKKNARNSTNFPFIQWLIDTSRIILLITRLNFQLKIVLQNQKFHQKQNMQEFAVFTLKPLRQLVYTEYLWMLSWKDCYENILPNKTRKTQKILLIKDAYYHSHISFLSFVSC